MHTLVHRHMVQAPLPRIWGSLLLSLDSLAWMARGNGYVTARAMLVMWSMLQSTTITCFCLDVVMTILWGLCVTVVLLQSKRLMRPVVYQARCFCADVGRATEQTISVIDAHVCAQPSPCNDVCRATEQALVVAQEKWLPMCVAWAMLQSAIFLTTCRPTINLADWTD